MSESQPTEVSQTDLYKRQILALHQALLVTNNDKNQLFLQLRHLAAHTQQLQVAAAAASKICPTPTPEEPDLINFEVDPEEQQITKSKKELLQENVALQSQVESLKSELKSCQDLKNEIEARLNQQACENEKISSENKSLREKLAQRDSGVSDSDDDEDETSYSSSTVVTKKPHSNNKRSRKNRRRTRVKRPQTPEQKYNNPSNPENIDSVLQSLAQEKLKTASLTEQVENLQSTINSKNLANRQLLETENVALEDSREKIKVYEKRMIDQAENYQATLEALEEENRHLEESNQQLQIEIESIGDYINIYRQQRTALKQMQYQENQNQIKLEEEKEELKAKLEYLVLLVRQLLGDRTMLSQNQRDLKEEELNTTEEIYQVIDEVTFENGLDDEPVQFKVEYLGPQQDLWRPDSVIEKQQSFLESVKKWIRFGCNISFQTCLSNAARVCI